MKNLMHFSTYYDLQNAILTENYVYNVEQSTEDIIEFIECFTRGFLYLRGANLRGAELNSRELSGCFLRNANFQNANLYCAELWNTNLQGANFQNANLNHACIGYANFRFANLQGANLDTNLLGEYGKQCMHQEYKIWTNCKEGEEKDFIITINNAYPIFTKATYDKDTIFPKGFNPQDHGMILINE